MIIAEVRSFQVGRYTVWQKPRLDNPAFAQYLVYLGKKLLGASFSVPDVECCRWVERNGSSPKYADQSAPLRRWTKRTG
jgi:hypothetical protein